MSDDKPRVWKHIGLYGHAVGTFTGEFIMVGGSVCNLRKEIGGCRDISSYCLCHVCIIIFWKTVGNISRGAALLYKGVGRGSLRDVCGKDERINMI